MAESFPSRHRGAAAGFGAASAPLSRWHYVAALALGALNTLSFAPTPHGGWLEIAVFVALYA